VLLVTIVYLVFLSFAAGASFFPFSITRGSASWNMPPAIAETMAALACAASVGVWFWYLRDPQRGLMSSIGCPVKSGMHNPWIAWGMLLALDAVAAVLAARRRNGAWLATVTTLFIAGGMIAPAYAAVCGAFD
jgi:cytochrome bd-type quinol oxidase subunit 2